MKRITALCLSATLLLSLTACGSSAPAADNPASSENEIPVLSVGETYTADDYAEISLQAVDFTGKIIPPITNGPYSYYECTDAGMEYADLIFSVKNLSASAISTEDLMTLTLSDDAAEYTDASKLLETEGGCDISSYETLAPLATGTYHYAVKVPTSSSVFTGKLTLDTKTYSLAIDQSSPDLSVPHQTITLNTPITAPDFAELTIQSVTYTTDILPSDTSGAYSHYAIKDSSKIYLAAAFTLKNLRSSASNAEDLCGIRAVYQGTYTYTGSLLAEESPNHLSSYASIDPLSTVPGYFMIEVPTEVQNGEVLLTLYFNGQYYDYVVPAVTH